MKDETNQKMNELLVRCYEGNATPEEAARLEAWVECSEENRKKAERMFALLLAADSHAVEMTVDVDAAGGCRAVPAAAGRDVVGTVPLHVRAATGAEMV